MTEVATAEYNTLKMTGMDRYQQSYGRCGSKISGILSILIFTELRLWRRLSSDLAVRL